MREMRIYIVPREYVEETSIRGGEYDGVWELPWKDGRPDYSVASGFVRATWHQHIYHTAHVSLTQRAATRIREALRRGDSLVYRDGPEHASSYVLWEASGGRCPHCHGGVRIETDPCPTA